MRDNGACGTIAHILPMLYPTFPSFKLEELRDSVFVGIVWPSAPNSQPFPRLGYSQIVVAGDSEY